MGGEKWPVIGFGPKQQMSNFEWIIQLKIAVFDEEGEEDEHDFAEKNFQKLLHLLSDNNMEMLYQNSYNWDEYYIGMLVKSVETVEKKELDNVRKFCKEFDLPEPVFLPGIIGEYE